jgi:hypothetical protein
MIAAAIITLIWFVLGEPKRERTKKSKVSPLKALPPKKPIALLPPARYSSDS